MTMSTSMTTCTGASQRGRKVGLSYWGPRWRGPNNFYLLKNCRYTSSQCGTECRAVISRLNVCKSLNICIFLSKHLSLKFCFWGVPGTKNFEMGVRGRIPIILGVLEMKRFEHRWHGNIGFLHTFSQFFKNSRSTSSQRGTRCLAVSSYICCFSIVKAWNNPRP